MSQASTTAMLSSALDNSTHIEGLLPGARKIWLGGHAPGLQVRLFRKCIHSVDRPHKVQMQIAAESYYHLWINGRYVTRGPVFHHTDILPIAILDLTPWWVEGLNVIAVLVFTPGFPTHKVMTGEPGLWSTIQFTNAAGNETWTATDQTWKVTNEVGWRRHVVRHGWALGPIEVLDASLHQWGWQDPAFDDSGWPSACRADMNNGSRQARKVLDLPSLTIGWSDAKSYLGAWAVGAEPAPLEDGQPCELIGEWIHKEPWKPICPNSDFCASWDGDDGTLTVDGLDPNAGVALVMDMGREEVGNIGFSVDCESHGVLELGWSEVLADGKPAMIHKDTAYVDRLLARPGHQSWDALQFSGLRYIVFILRGFKGSVRFRRIGVRTSTSVPTLRAEFSSSDHRLNDIWSLCTRTLSIGTQETIIDCPSREQAPYLGDGHLVGQWLGLLNNDYRHWRYLLQLGFGSQADDGLMRDAPLFPVQRSLIDYVLLTVMALREYVDLTGDRDFGIEKLDGCRRAVRYFDAHLLEDGLLSDFHVPGARFVAWDIPGPPRRTPSLDPHLFIDHAGLGGHNVGEPGIERRGRNAALNALYSLALDSLSDLEERFGDPAMVGKRRQMAEKVRSAAGSAYWDASRGLFVDAIDTQGRQCKQVSQQTNILAILANWPGPESHGELVRRILQPDGEMAQCGPYFYAYLLPLMYRLGLHREALGIIRDKWGRMLDAGATTLWETFCGDGHDTWCHPWAAAPVAFFINHLLGINTINQNNGLIELHPRYDLLPSASGSIPSAAGHIRIRWSHEDGQVRLSGVIPQGMHGILYNIDGTEAERVVSDWCHILPLSTPTVVTTPLVIKRRSSIYA